MRSLVIALVVLVALYVGFVVTLLVLGRRQDARAWGGLIPDCLVVFKRLLNEPDLGRRYKAMLFALIGYLALPIDLVPDFIPVAGQLDDAILVALVLRVVLRRTGPQRLSALWPGPGRTRDILLRLAGYRA